jgi:hypothetical protein
MKTINVADATGPALDWLVDNIEGVKNYGVKDWLEQRRYGNNARYSTDWAQGGPIIDREKISVLWRPGRSVYWACCNGQDPADEEIMGADGPTALIAAMRCYVASKMGDEVEIPDELV